MSIATPQFSMRNNTCFDAEKNTEQNPNDCDATNLFDVVFFAFAHVKINLFVEIMVSNVYDQPLIS